MEHKMDQCRLTVDAEYVGQVFGIIGFVNINKFDGNIHSYTYVKFEI